jgi:predicted RNA-binding Zn ribbon-like protein
VSTGLNRTAIDPEAELLVEFVNTRDIEEETDAIADAPSLSAWIDEKTEERVGGLDKEDLSRVLALRESLRALLSANNGGEIAEAELTPVREAAERCHYRTTFSPDGHLSIAPVRSDLSGFEARLLLGIERLQSLGAWPRLKACTDEECQWAFYDTTRNHSRTWCSMDVCGNREKTRRYRARKSGS